MIIHEPKIEKIGNRIRVSTYIESESDASISDTLWYEFDAKYKKYIATNMDGFVSATIMLAMNLGEDMTVKGYISPKFSYGIQQLQRYFNYWYPNMFRQISISPIGYKKRKVKTKGGMCTFSGGVDAFYTLQKHLPDNESNPNFQITHCLLLDGFALPRNERMNKSYSIINDSYAKLIKDLGLQMVFVKTNAASLYQNRVVPALLDGPMLSVVPLLLDGVVSNFYIASCLTYGQMLPRGSNAITNNMLSTETLDVRIHGSEKNRAEKIESIAKWPATYDHLRVCWDDFGVKNCGKCEKCVRTMIALEATGNLKRYSTFAKPLTRTKTRRWLLKDIYHFWFAEENIALAKKIGRRDLVFDIKYAMHRSNMVNRLPQIVTMIYKSSAWLKKRSPAYTKFVAVCKQHVA